MDPRLIREILGKICIMTGTDYDLDGISDRLSADYGLSLHPAIISLVQWKFGIVRNSRSDRLAWLDVLLTGNAPETEAIAAFEDFSQTGDYSMLGFRFGLLGVQVDHLRQVSSTTWPRRLVFAGHRLGAALVAPSQDDRSRLKAIQKALESSELPIKAIEKDIRRVAPEILPSLQMKITIERGVIPKVVR